MPRGARVVTGRVRVLLIHGPSERPPGRAHHWEPAPVRPHLAPAPRWVGSPRSVLTLTAFGVVWLVVGAVTDLPRWWELVLSVGFPFLTLLLVTLVQHSQNHDSNAIELKLDELLASLDSPSDAMIRIGE